MRKDAYGITYMTEEFSDATKYELIKSLDFKNMKLLFYSMQNRDKDVVDVVIKVEFDSVYGRSSCTFFNDNFIGSIELKGINIGPETVTINDIPVVVGKHRAIELDSRMETLVEKIIEKKVVKKTGKSVYALVKDLKK